MVRYGTAGAINCSQIIGSVLSDGSALDEVIGRNENYTLTFLRLGSSPTDKQIDDILQQTRANARGFSCFIAMYRGWLGNRVVSVLDSGAVGPGSNRSRDDVG